MEKYGRRARIIWSSRIACRISLKQFRDLRRRIGLAVEDAVAWEDEELEKDLKELDSLLERIQDKMKRVRL